VPPTVLRSSRAVTDSISIIRALLDVSIHLCSFALWLSYGSVDLIGMPEIAPSAKDIGVSIAEIEALFAPIIPASPLVPSTRRRRIG
jgi:hypothetical protein